MSYTVSAINTAGAISLHRDSAQGAVKKAQELIKEGLMEVKITDQAGNQFHDVSEFQRLITQ